MKIKKIKIPKLIKKGIKISVCLVLVTITGSFLLSNHVKSNAKKNITTIDKLSERKEAADAVIVLGAYVRPNGNMSLILKERVDMGIDIYNAGYANKIIMSGDHGQEDYDEVNTMKDYAISQGVPSEDIFMDHAGFSTYESMYRAREIFEAEDVIVVTQEYHLYRAVYDGKVLDLQVEGIACDKAVYSGDTIRKVREVLARVKDFGYSLIKPEPTYLGETIPISGNGNITND